MKKRIVKKANKKQMLKIMDKIQLFSKNITFENIRFGNGYFIMTFGDNTVAHFTIKEIPNWSFGLWLGEDKISYSFFGQPTVLIDKFKPSCSEVDYTDKNLADNIDILNKLSRGIDVYEVNEDIEESLLYRKNKDIVEFERLSKIQNYIKETDNVYSNYHLKLVDRNTKKLSISPRYSIRLYVSPTDKLDLKDKQEIFKELCEIIPAEKQGIYFLDDFIYEPFAAEVINQETWEKRSIEYNWKNKDFDKYMAETC